MKKLLLLTALLLVLIVLTILISSQKNLAIFSPSTFSSPSSGASSPTPLQAASQEKSNIIALAIRNGKLASGPNPVIVAQDSLLILRISSDVDQPLSVAGYNKQVMLERNKSVIFSFLATTPGTFQYVLPTTQVVVGEIQVTAK